MKKIYYALLIVSAAGFAQPRYAEIKIEQVARPDYNAASHVVITTVLARAANSYEWIPAYEHDTIVKKFRDTGKAKLKEIAHARIAGKKYLAEAVAAEKNKQLPVLGTEVHER